ncbi:MAG: AraC family transcriptional regulator [Bacteroidota bacterium]
MKPLNFFIPKIVHESFRVQVDRQPHFYDVLHCHPEIQLKLVVKSEGVYSVAHQMGNFMDGDIFLLGPDVPHVFRNGESWYNGTAGEEAHGISLFFKEDSFGQGLFELPEFLPVKQLLAGSTRGVKLSKKLAGELLLTVLSMPDLSGAARIIQLLYLLEKIAISGDYEFLSPPIEQHFQREDFERLNKITAYILDHYAQSISLEEIAGEVHLSPSAFCRFFKKRTRKSFVEYLNEFRISMACKMLVESKEPVAQICYKTGFNNLANFNRQFRRVTGMTPTGYRKFM